MPDSACASRARIRSSAGGPPPTMAVRRSKWPALHLRGDEPGEGEAPGQEGGEAGDEDARQPDAGIVVGDLGEDHGGGHQEEGQRPGAHEPQRGSAQGAEGRHAVGARRPGAGRRPGRRGRGRRRGSAGEQRHDPGELQALDDDARGRRRGRTPRSGRSRRAPPARAASGRPGAAAPRRAAARRAGPPSAWGRERGRRHPAGHGHRRRSWLTSGLGYASWKRAAGLAGRV